jgi:hypothetical protein
MMERSVSVKRQMRPDRARVQTRLTITLLRRAFHHLASLVDELASAIPDCIDRERVLRSIARVVYRTHSAPPACK